MLATIASLHPSDHCMSLECTNRLSASAFTGVLVAAVLLSNPIQPVAAQGNVRDVVSWGATFRSQVEMCWKKPPAVAGEAANIRTEFAVKLTREGRLVEQPVPSPESLQATSDYARAYQASALRAITACQPYRLPIEHYDQWKYFMSVFIERPGPPEKPADGLNARSPSICRGC